MVADFQFLDSYIRLVENTIKLETESLKQDKRTLRSLKTSKAKLEKKYSK
jgi:hypothetical protein